jgi:hypothetical protein
MTVTVIRLSRRFTLAVELANVYTLRVESAAVANASSKWLNTFDIYKTGGPPDSSDGIIVDIVAAIADNQWHDSQVQKISLRNWTRGKVTLDVAGLIWEVDGLTSVGNAKTVYSLSESGPADTDICMLCHKNQDLTGGRIGKLFLHNLMRSDMVDNQVGRKPTLVSGLAGFQALVTANFTSHLGSVMGPALSPGLVTVHWSAKPGAAAPFQRSINQISALRVTEHQFGRTNG